MKLPPMMRILPGPFGIPVVHVAPLVGAHVLLPECFERVAELARALGISIEQAADLVDHQPAGMVVIQQERLPLHLEKAMEARRSQQPPGWGDRTYQSVTGLRWRCCWNLFEDEHSPWCPAGSFEDPLPL